MAIVPIASHAHSRGAFAAARTLEEAGRSFGARRAWGPSVRRFSTTTWLFGAALAAFACRASDPHLAATGAASGEDPAGGGTSDASHASHQGAPETAPAPSVSGSSPSPPEPSVFATTEVFDLGPETREFVLVVPRTYTAARAYPLVLVFHGDGGTGPSMRETHNFDDQSRDGAIVVYPSGKDRAWDLYTRASENADDAFVVALVEHLTTRFNIDRARVFGTGFSKGAFFINQLACRKPALFRAIAGHAGGAPYEPEDPAATSWPNGYVQCADQTTGVAALVVHGLDDSVVPFESGDFEAEYWAYVNGCTRTRIAGEPPPCVAYEGCPAELPVTFCAIPGLGHALWPEAAQAAWSFFVTMR